MDNFGPKVAKKTDCLWKCFLFIFEKNPFGVCTNRSLSVKSIFLPLADPFSEERIYRMRIEDILYYSDTKEQSAEVNTYISKLLKKLPPPEVMHGILSLIGRPGTSNLFILINRRHLHVFA